MAPPALSTATTTTTAALNGASGKTTVTKPSTFLTTNSVAPLAPVTLERPLPSNLEKDIVNPGMPRATIAIDREHPHIIRDDALDPKVKNMSVLQQHIEFFDRNKDGKISPLETYQGFRAIGFNIFISLLSVIIIHANFAYPTQTSWIPDPRLYIHIERIHKAKHGSDSETYDTEGRFVPQKFEEMFSKYAKTRPDALTGWELLAMTESNRNVMDPIGWFGSKFEFGALFLLTATHEPSAKGAGRMEWIVTKEKLRGQYDGSLFYVVEAEIKEKKRLAQIKRTKSD
ncbi:hypothetical protein RI367_006124 [Sorochytrium milnesiophthora]